MKAILSYGSYFNRGKQYQLKFVYNNETVSVSEQLTTLINELVMKGAEFKQLVKPYYIDNSGKVTVASTNTIGGVNIPKDLLLEVINTIIEENNIPVVISNQEHTTFDEKNIQKSINKLHINATLTKGDYFNFGQMYYITFKYANDEQRNEVLYGFSCQLQNLIGDVNPENNYIFPFIVDRAGNLSIKNTGIIGGTNIPKTLLPLFIKKFIEDYDMIITIDDKIMKDEESFKEIQTAIATFNPGKQGRARKRTMQ